VAQEATLRLVGQFSGYSLSPGTIVPPAFLILKRGDRRDGTTQVVLAEEQAEGEALRALRLDPEGELSTPEQKFDVYRTPTANFRAASWRPIARRQLRLLDLLRREHTPTVADLFDIRIGLTVWASPFFLDVDEFDTLPTHEQEAFRPVADGHSVRDGRLRRTRYVFCPWLIPEEAVTEEGLRGRLPQYFTRHLEPKKVQIAGRPRPSLPWWLPCNPTRIPEPGPKFVVPRLTGRGRFAYDASGDYVVGDALGLFWCGVQDRADDEDDTEVIDFTNGPMPWAYLALLNSSVFYVLLGHFCSSLKGHFRLNIRDMEAIPLPDLSSDDSDPEIVEALAELGRAIHRGSTPSPAALTQVAAAAYRVPVTEWGLDKAGM
jgi:hypothetical protein